MVEMRYSVVLGQRASWPELLRRTRLTEELGFDGLFLVDHFYGLTDIEDPTHEAYTMLAALAPFTSRIRLGVMVCGNTYRNPAFLLKQAITVDHVSGGRVDFGVGAGWVEREHEAFGFDFPSAGERVSRFAEALEIWKQLQRNRRTTYEGAFYHLLDAPFEPKSLQPDGLPVLIGGSGPRMMRLVAKYAVIWNGIGGPDEAGEQNRKIDEACRAGGRDPATLRRAVSPSINLLASPVAFAEGARAYAAAGFDHITFPWPRVDEEEPVLRTVAREVLPELRREKSGSVAAAAPATRPPVEKGDIDAIRAWLADVDNETGRRALLFLMNHPGERFDGSALRDALGIETHRDITRAFGRLGASLAERGYGTLWNEAQRGYLMTAEDADLLQHAGG